MFTFNNNYKDKEQVRQFMPRFIELREAMAAAGQYPYNSCFVGKIPGAEGPNEETAIYLLQCLYSIEAEQRAMAQLRTELEPLTELAETQKFSRIVAYEAGHYVGGTGRRQSFEDARIVPRDGKPYVVLPKGKRTKGYRIAGAEVLVKR